MKKAVVAVAVAALAILGMAATMAKHGASVVYAHDGNVVGTWFVTVTVNTPPGAPPFIFTDMVTFNPEGTLVATSTAFNSHTSEVLPGPLGVDTSDAYGVWEPGAGPNEVRITFKRFLFAGANPSSTALYSSSAVPGQDIGVNTVEAVGTSQAGEDGATLAGPFTSQFANLEGTNVFAGKGTFSATRIKVEPMAP
jgi:hypothetical protein